MVWSSVTKKYYHCIPLYSPGENLRVGSRIADSHNDVYAAEGKGARVNWAEVGVLVLGDLEVGWKAGVSTREWPYSQVM